VCTAPGPALRVERTKSWGAGRERYLFQLQIHGHHRWNTAPRLADAMGGLIASQRANDGLLLVRRGDASYDSWYTAVSDVELIVSPTHVTWRMRP
jgi:hypothetical protein